MSMTIHSANVIENIDLFSTALLKSCSEKSILARNFYDKYPEIANTLTLASKGFQIVSSLSIVSIVSICSVSTIGTGRFIFPPMIFYFINQIEIKYKY